MYTLRAISLTIILCNSITRPNVTYSIIDSESPILITPESERIGHTWHEGTVWEKHLIEKFYRILKSLPKDCTVLDLGAQTGCFSLLAKYFPDSLWHSFEPVAEVADELRKNLALNGITNVMVHQYAATDYTGSITLHMPAMNAWGLCTIGSNVQRFEELVSRTVNCIDLDSFLSESKIKKVDLIKIDTEGAELSILKGAKNIIQMYHPIILMEYNQVNMSQCNARPEDIDSFLISMGYVWELVSTEDILCYYKQ